MSYFTAISTALGLNRLPTNPCKLLDFAYLTLNDSERYATATGDREVLAVIFGGKGDFSAAGHEFRGVGGRPNVFAGKPYSVYLPCGTDTVITARGHLEVGLLSAPSDLALAPYVISPDRVTSGVWGAANFSRSYQQILTVAGQPDLPARRLVAGETYVPSGNWATYPPHKHEVDDLPREAFQEEMYFFKVNPPDGFGMVRYYNSEIDAGYIIKDNTVMMAPNGYHTNNCAPGYTCYFLWFMAGEQRVQAASEDPALTWVARTVPMLKALGH
ncbi:MAG: 5-deoxy-glucuronate isomerase [Chloroflexi bacterium]|nr:5-deoxy-glucuronate isomerase [Chloroflexota bacterium]